MNEKCTRKDSKGVFTRNEFQPVTEIRTDVILYRRIVFWYKWVRHQFSLINRLKLLPPANEVWGKVICLQVCVCPQGGPGPRGCLLRWGVWSGGLTSGDLPPPPLPERVLLRAVRILLECILVNFALNFGLKNFVTCEHLKTGDKFERKRYVLYNLNICTSTATRGVRRFSSYRIYLAIRSPSCKRSRIRIRNPRRHPWIYYFDSKGFLSPSCSLLNRARKRR